jgi:Methyltransferase domain
MQQEVIATFIQAFKTAVSAGTLLKCTLSKPTPHVEAGLKNVYLRPVVLKKGGHIAFNFRYQTRDEVKNHLPDVAALLLQNMLGESFLHADLFGTDQDHSLQISAKGVATLTVKKAAQTIVPPPAAHNREKQRLLSPAAPWLHQLGITNAQGTVLAHAQDKWRQINKYLEIIQSLVHDTPLPNDACIADMGSGKGYLTFALYDFLKNNLGMSPQITGIELRENLVTFCNQTARDCGFEGLSFMAQNINTYQPERLDMLIALHACDTATDMALAAGIRQKAKIIVAAPCCHKQVRKSMAAQNELAPVLRHGILEERQAEIITDGIRALLLEASGYQTRVFEFISTEHTAKNVMITAVKPEDLRTSVQNTRREKALAQVEALKQGFGLAEHFLEQLLAAHQK